MSEEKNAVRSKRRETTNKFKSPINLKFRKTPKIGPGSYIFERTLLRGLYSEGLIYGGAYYGREICV